MPHTVRSRVRPGGPLFLTLACGACFGLLGPGAAWAARITRAEGRTYAHGAAVALLGPKVQEVRVSVATLPDPPRLILTLDGAALARGVAAELPLALPGVTRARLAQFRTGPDVARLVLDLDARIRPPQLRLAQGKRRDELLLLFEPSGPVTLTAPVVQRQQGTWVVRIPGVGYLPHRTGALENPPRVFLDFTNAEVPASSGRNFLTGPIRGVRVGRQAAEGDTPKARVAIELRTPQPYAETTEGADLVLSFGGTPTPGAPPGEADSPPAAPAPSPTPPPPAGTYDVPLPPASYDVPPPPFPSLRGRTIVVDPGHGGGDPGAMWSSDDGDVTEDAITYDIAVQLTHLLREAGAEVTMTHGKDDPYLKPLDRARLANRLQPEAFVSIHCNSCSTPSETARGTTVYFGHEASIPLARDVQEELATELGTKDRGIEREIFTVIDRTECPAILVETAFISHDGDRKLLTDPHVRARAAQAIQRGLARFFADAEKGRAQ